PRFACPQPRASILSEVIVCREFTLRPSLGPTVKGNGMRRLGGFFASACRPQNLLCVALVGVSVWAASIGLLPIGPKARVAVEARLVSETNAPGPDDRRVTRLVALNMRREH